ncbi:MAG: restriction endonuclease [Thermodesulfovibrionales bacterium]|jgi:restriction system protein|nr:restriction endonuclease [Thermodesulfovibrionales bacterium]
MKQSENIVPTYDKLFNPVVKALQFLGGSGTIEEINQKVIELENIPDEIMEIPHGDTDGGRSEVEYRLAWARTYLKKYGVLENSARGVWALTSNAANIKEVDPSEVIRKVREQIAEQKDTRIVSDNNNEVMQGLEQPDEIQNWKERLIDVLLSIEPSAFERLVQRILRENGFTQVEVTGRTGDGGIDGKGIARINGFLSFHVMFQCKRYQGSVSASQIRDFRGAMQGRADKGLFITTGTFTRDAIREATRDGAPPIDLIDGDQLTDKLKELKLGLRIEIVEKIDIDEEWYKKI